MTDSHPQPATGFEPDEGPTHPCAFIPEEIGPRGTVRILARAERGPTGTVAMPARKDPADGARRAARIRRIIVAVIALLCALDIGWVALSPAPAPPAPPVITPARAPAP